MDIPLLNRSKPEDVADPPIPGNSLNVTRVTGLAALVSAVLAAITPIFSAEASDPTALRVAMPAIQGLIVAAALFTAAIVVAADIRGRATATAPVTAAPPIESPSADRSVSTREKYALDLGAALGEMSGAKVTSIELSALARTVAECKPPPGHAVRNNVFVLEIEKLAGDVAKGAEIGNKFSDIYHRILRTSKDLK